MCAPTQRGICYHVAQSCVLTHSNMRVSLAAPIVQVDRTKSSSRPQQLVRGKESHGVEVRLCSSIFLPPPIPYKVLPA
jgi:hypothetical protein